MENLFFTSKTVEENKKNLPKFQFGRTWVYTNTFENFKKNTDIHKKCLLNILDKYPICRFNFLAAMARKESIISNYEAAYIRCIANMACSNGQAHKILCRDFNNKIYACYFSLSYINIIQRILTESYERLLLNTNLRFKQIAIDFFNDEKGSYYWAKALLEHLVYLRIAYHFDEWRIAS